MSLLRLLIPLLACVPLISTAQDSFKGKVAYVKETSYFVVGDKGSLKENPVHNERVRTWNNNQQLLTSKEIRHHIEGLNDSGWTGVENCIYNKDNQLVERTFSYPYMCSHSIRKYDNNGRLVEDSGEAKHDNGDSTWGKEEYLYSEAGKKIEVRSVSNDHTYPRSIQYYNGERLDSSISFGKGTVVSRTHVSYNAAGNETERRFSDEKDRHSSIAYRYDDKGRKVEERRSDYHKVLEGRTVFKYNDNGDVTLVTQYDGNGKLYKSTTNTYNEKGYLIKVVTADHNKKNGVEISDEYEYTDFDTVGNPLKKTERWMRDGKPLTFVTVYEIGYYK